VQIIYGVNPVREIIKREGEKIKEILVAAGKKGPAIQNILTLATEKHIPFVFKDRRHLDSLAGCPTHQGVVAFCEPYAYAPIDELIGQQTGDVPPTILILDELTDPQNLGALIRTAHCLGVRGVIIPENRSVSVNATVIKASAGAAHWLPIAREVNLVRAIAYLKERGFWIYGAEAGDGTELEKFADSGPVGLVLGSEGQGLRPLIKKQCDYMISIPMAGKVGSLNVSVAAGIILYEMMSKRGRKE